MYSVFILILACIGVMLMSLIIGAVAAIFTDNRKRGAEYVQHTD